MSLVPLNSPKCPHCGNKIAARGGYVKEKKGSLWKCRDSACNREFFVPTLVIRETTS